MGRKANLKRIKRIAKKMPVIPGADHNKSMKQLYNRVGAAGVQGYMMAVSSYQSKKV